MFNKKLINCCIVILLLGFFVLFFQVEIVSAKTCAQLATETGLPYTCELPTPGGPAKCGSQGQRCESDPGPPDDHYGCGIAAEGQTECCVCNIHSSGGDSLVGSLSESCRKTGTCELNDFARIFLFIAKWILGITGSLALLFFVYGGVMLLISGGSSERVTKAKQIIISAVIGLLIVFTAYMIIGFIMQSMGATPDMIKWATTSWFK